MRFAILGLFLLTGCAKHTVDITDNYYLPDELKGCKVYRLHSGGLYSSLYVVVRDGKPVSTSLITGDKNDPVREVITP